MNSDTLILYAHTSNQQKIKNEIKHEVEMYILINWSHKKNG